MHTNRIYKDENNLTYKLTKFKLFKIIINIIIIVVVINNMCDICIHFFQHC